MSIILLINFETILSHEHDCLTYLTQIVVPLAPVIGGIWTTICL